MPRTFGRIQTDIWDDADFRALSEPAQRLYFMLISQSDLSLAGVLPLTPARWAGYSFQSTEDGINKALDELVATRFLLVDTASQEVAIRSFLEHGQVVGNANLARGAMRALDAVHSKALVDDVLDGVSDGVRTALHTASGRDPGRHPIRRPDAVPKGVRTPSHTASGPLEMGDGRGTTPPNALSKTQAEVLTVENRGGGKPSGHTPEIVSHAIRLLAERDLAQAEARAIFGTPLRDPEAFFRSRLEHRSLHDAATLGSLVADDPDLTAARLANRLEPPEVNSPPAYVPEGTGNGVKPDMAAVRAAADNHRKRSTL